MSNLTTLLSLLFALLKMRVGSGAEDLPARLTTLAQQMKSPPIAYTLTTRMDRLVLFLTLFFRKGDEAVIREFGEDAARDIAWQACSWLLRNEAVLSTNFRRSLHGMVGNREASGKVWLLAIDITDTMLVQERKTRSGRS